MRFHKQKIKNVLFQISSISFYVFFSHFPSFDQLLFRNWLWKIYIYIVIYVLFCCSPVVKSFFLRNQIYQFYNKDEKYALSKYLHCWINSICLYFILLFISIVVLWLCNISCFVKIHSILSFVYKIWRETFDILADVIHFLYDSISCISIDSFPFNFTKIFFVSIHLVILLWFCIISSISFTIFVHLNNRR